VHHRRNGVNDFRYTLRDRNGGAREETRYSTNTFAVIGLVYPWMESKSSVTRHWGKSFDEPLTSIRQCSLHAGVVLSLSLSLSLSPPLIHPSIFALSPVARTVVAAVFGRNTRDTRNTAVRIQRRRKYFARD